jgi:hypothetical protein
MQDFEKNRFDKPTTLSCLLVESKNSTNYEFDRYGVYQSFVTFVPVISGDWSDTQRSNSRVEKLVCWFENQENESKSSKLDWLVMETGSGERETV